VTDIPSIDLLTPPFWICFALALVLINPIVLPRARSWAFALLNVAFPAYYLGVGPALGLIVVVLLIMVGLRLFKAGRSGLITLGVGGVVLALAFTLHKLPDLSSRFGPQVFGWLRPGNNLMHVIGFSYVALRIVEVVRGVADGRHESPSFDSLINYLIPFNMLAAGPVQAYDEFANQPAPPAKLKLPEAFGAIERIVLGMFKKYVLAYLLDSIYLTGFTAEGWYLIVEAQFFFLWLYLDFSAYSDIAVGVGRLVGIETPENFDKPYLARNLVNFWERWHISLSLFIRRNLFLPLQIALVRRFGTAHALLFGSIAFTISFLLCGLWHQLSFIFLLWGGMHALGLVAVTNYRHWLGKRLGAQGLDRYLENPWIRSAAVFVTYEYVAFSLVVIAYPWPTGQ